jgi:hypothetical protein
MKSGDYSVDRISESFKKQFSEIRDRAFVQRTFSTRSALVATEQVNGHRMTKDYHGGAYDESKFTLVPGTWDHEHCSVCWFKITNGFTYWENAKRIKILCDACHEAFATE